MSFSESACPTRDLTSCLNHPGSIGLNPYLFFHASPLPHVHTCPSLSVLPSPQIQGVLPLDSSLASWMLKEGLRRGSRLSPHGHAVSQVFLSAIGGQTPDKANGYSIPSLTWVPSGSQNWP